MAQERGDSSASIGGTSSDTPSTFEQSTLKGTTQTGNARLIVRDATQIEVIDTNNYWTALTVEGVLDEIGGLDLQTQITDNDTDISALDVRVTQNETDISQIQNDGATVWGNLVGTLSDQTDLQAELDAKEDAHPADLSITQNGGDAIHFSNKATPSTADFIFGVQSVSAGIQFENETFGYYTNFNPNFGVVDFVNNNHKASIAVDGVEAFSVSEVVSTSDEVRWTGYHSGMGMTTGTLRISGSLFGTVALGITNNSWNFNGYTGTCELTSNETAAFTSNAQNAANAIAYQFDTANNYAASGAKLMSVANNATEKFYITKDGDASSAATAPTDDSHLTRKDYVDDLVEAIPQPNTIINGNFDVWQRGTSFAAVANEAYTADRFKYQKSGSTTAVHTIARSSDVPTVAESNLKSNYSYHLDVTTADATVGATDYSLFVYSVEGYDYAQLAGGNATLSFWVKAAKTGIHCVALRNSGVDRTYVAEYTVAVADTWEYITLTIPLTETGGTWDYSNGAGLYISWTLAVGSTFQTTAGSWQTGNLLGSANQVNELDSTANNFRIAQVKLEKGDVATPWQPVNYQEELAKCQRYFYRTDSADASNAYCRFATGMCISTQLANVHIDHPVRMRTYATLGYSAAGDFAGYVGATIIACTALSSAAALPDGHTIGVTVASGMTAGYACMAIANATNNAYLEFNAEL